MVSLIEKELRIKDEELKALLTDISMDTTPGTSSKVESINAEKEILQKLLKEQRQHRRQSLFALENGLLLFAIAMFGVLAAFVVYVVGVTSAAGTWEQLGSEMAVLVLLIVMSTMSAVLYFQYYKQRITRK